jgi:hypothetical protein
MKKTLKIIAVLLLAIFVFIQFFRPDFTSPPVNPAETLTSSTEVPENVQAILQRSCSDCHTNETTLPWYSKIQPSAQFLKNHIDDGRAELNFSVWNTYDARRKKRKLEEICEMIETREMPLPSYLWIHWNAKLTEEDIKTLCDWTKLEIQNIDSPQ